MKIKSVKLIRFKRFSDLTVTEIPESARLIVLVGPNGCGKTSLFEAFNHWYNLNGYGNIGDRDYYEKKDGIVNNGSWYQNKVTIKFYGDQDMNQNQLKGKFYFRSAYRNDPDFTISNLNKQTDPTKDINMKMLIQTFKLFLRIIKD